MTRERPALFKRRYLEAEIIVLCVRWYLLYPLSFRLEEILAERNLSIDHVTFPGATRRIAKDDIAGQAMFVENILGLTIR